MSPYEPNDVPPPEDGGPGRSGLATAFPFAVAAVAAVVLLAVGAVVAVARGGGSGGDDAAADGAEPDATSTTTLPSNVGTVAPTTTAGGSGGASGAASDLPPVTIPAQSSPPTTIPGSEPNSIPLDIMSGEEAPEWGTLVVDLEENGYQDFAVHLRDDQELQLLSLGDDGIETDIEVFAPDGSSEGRWQGGEPGVVNGLEWYRPGEPLPATGTYVIRVIHTGGRHDPFALGFFGNA